MNKPNDQNPESTDSARPAKAPNQFRPDSPTPGQKAPQQVTPADVIKAKDAGPDSTDDSGQQQ